MLRKFTFATIPGLILTCLLLPGCGPAAYTLLTGKQKEFFDGTAHAPVRAREWWRDLGNEELNALVTQALRDNPSIAVLTERKFAAGKNADGALAQLLPTATAQSVSGYQSKGSDFFAQFQPSAYPYSTLSMSWELPIFGKAQATWSLNQAQQWHAALNEEGARLSVVADVVDAFAKGSSDSKQLQATRRALAHLERQASSEEIGATAHLRTRGDVQSAKNAVITYRDKCDDLESDLSKQVEAIRALTSDQSANPSFAGTLALPYNIDAPQPTWIRTRPDVAGAEADVKEAAANAGIARSEILPQLSFSASVSKTPGVLHTSTNSLGLTVPLLGWFAAKMNADSKLHEMQASVYVYRDTVNKAWREASEQYLDFSALKVRCERARNAAAEARGDAGAYKSGSDLGGIAASDWWKTEISAEDRLRESEDCDLSLVESWLKYQKAVFASTQPLPAEPVVNDPLVRASH